MATRIYTQTYNSVTGVATFSPIDVHFTPISVVSDLQVNPFVFSITDTSARVSWSTLVPTAYDLLYTNGICPPAGCSLSDAAYVGTHQITLTNLTPSTTYTFKVVAKTEFGLSITSADVTFSTIASPVPGTPPPPPPVIDTTPASIISANVPAEWNINALPSIQCSFIASANTDYIKYYFPSQPGSQPDGSVVVNVTGVNGNKAGLITLYDPLEIGNYTLAVIAGNGITGDGIINYYPIVVDKVFSYGQPDITQIDYTQTIQEADFTAPFQYNFDFKLTSVNSEFIEVYAGSSTTTEPALVVAAAGNPSTNFSFNAGELYSIKPAIWTTATNGPLGAGNYYAVTFSFVPYVIGVTGKIYGKVESITIFVKRSENILTDAQANDYLVKKFRDYLNLHSNLLAFDDERYLKYHLKYQDTTFDSYVISNFGKDENTFSIPTGKTYDVANAEPTEYILDPETGNTTRKYPSYKTLIVKLLEPLPAEIEINTQLWIAKQLIPTVIEDIVITDGDVQVCIPLQPNFNADVLNQTGYQYFNDIVGTNAATSTQIVNKYISQSAFNLADLAIDYTSGSNITGSEFLKFENFVNFSSAKTRIENFQYKLSSIKFWEDKISSSLYVGGSPSTNAFATSTAQSYTNTVWQIKNGFDGFETKMYTNYSVTSSASPFFTYQADYADQYDRFNKNYLVNHLPSYLTNTSGYDENQEFILFLEMVGQHFDVLWAYIKGLHRAKVIRNSAEEGIPDKLVHTLLENLGWDAQQPFGGMQLWKEAFGLNSNGTQFTNTNILGNSITPAYSPEEARKQVWRRILNNLPYLLKHKGTKRAIYAIMACYGIPSSMLYITEFNSSVPQTTTNVNSTNFTYKTTTSNINVNGTSYIVVPYYPASPPPTAVQIRFATNYQIPYATSATGSQLLRMNVSGSNSYWQVNLLPTGTGSYGDINLIIRSGSATSARLSITSSVIFDNDWKNLTVQKEQFTSASGVYDRFTLYVKEAVGDRLIMDQSASLILPTSSLTSVFTSTGSLYFGAYGSTPGISGAFDEARVWNTALSESVVTAHALNPDVIYGNDIYATTTNLLVRLDFEYPKDRNADPYIKNVSPKVAFSGSTAIGGYTGYATASMGYSATTYPYHYTPYDRTGTSVISSLGFIPSDKIQTSTQELVGSLSYNQRATKKITQVSGFDSNRLGVLFSPVRDLNLDIVHSLGDINIGDYIGSWEDEYGKDSYKDLQTLKSYYFKRTNLDFTEYIKLVKSVDSSFYKMLEQLSGQRVKLLTGLVIEPSVLERSKILINKPTAENAYNSSSISLRDIVNLEANYNEYNIVFNQTDFSKNLDCEVSTYTASINSPDILSVSSTISDLEALSNLNFLDNVNLIGETVYSKNSNGSSIDVDFDVKYEDSTLVSEFDLEKAYQNVGVDIDSPFINGFGVIGQNGSVDRTYRRADGTLVLTERNNAYILTIKHMREIPSTNIDGVITNEKVARYEKKLLFVSQSDVYAGGTFRAPAEHSFYTNVTGSLGIYPYDKGVVTNIELFNGYTSGHYRFTKDTTRGLENSRFNGSKQTIFTTLDNTLPVEVFATNPNTLKVSNAGRGSGEPILETT